MSLQLLCLHTKFCQNPPLTASSLNYNKPWGLVLHQHFNFLMKNWPSFLLACEHPKPISLMPCYTTKGNNGACNSNLAVPARALCHFDLSSPGRVCCSPIPSAETGLNLPKLIVKGMLSQPTGLVGAEKSTWHKEVWRQSLCSFHIHFSLWRWQTEREKWQALSMHHGQLAASQSKV